MAAMAGAASRSREIHSISGLECRHYLSIICRGDHGLSHFAIDCDIGENPLPQTRHGAFSPRTKYSTHKI
jgi:hypothetical protein